jgi:hypothetical protein
MMEVYPETMIEWGWFVLGWYNALRPSAQASLWEQSGVRPPRKEGDDRETMDSLGDAVSLFWTADESPAMAQGYTSEGWPVFEIDPRQMSIYGFFTPDVLGRAETVLVLPTSCPQGLPGAVVGVWLDE